MSTFVNVKWTVIVLSLWPLWFSVTYQRFIHCGHLILRKISKFDATRCHILRLKCTKFDFCWGSAPDPTGRAYNAPRDPHAVFKGLILRGGGERGQGSGQGMGRGEEGKVATEGREMEGFAGPMSKCFLRTCWMVVFGMLLVKPCWCKESKSNTVSVCKVA